MANKVHYFHRLEIVGGPSHEDLMLAQWSNRPGETHEVTFRFPNYRMDPISGVARFFIFMADTSLCGRVHLIGFVRGNFLRAQFGYQDIERRPAEVRNYNFETRQGELIVFEEKLLNPIIDWVPAR